MLHSSNITNSLHTTMSPTTTTTKLAPHTMAELAGVAKPKRSRRKQSELMRPFECETCLKHYATKAALSLHFKLKHEGAAPLKSWSELQQAVKSGQFVSVNTERLAMAAAQQQHANALFAARDNHNGNGKLRRRDARHSFEPTTASNTVSHSSSSEELDSDIIDNNNQHRYRAAAANDDDDNDDCETILNATQQELLEQRQLQQLHSAASDVEDDVEEDNDNNDENNNNKESIIINHKSNNNVDDDIFVKPALLSVNRHRHHNHNNNDNNDIAVTFDLNNFGTYSAAAVNNVDDTKKISLENLLNGCVDVQNLPRTENLGTELRWKRLPRFYSRDDGVSVKDEDAAATLLFELACRNKAGGDEQSSSSSSAVESWRRKSFVVIS